MPGTLISSSVGHNSHESLGFSLSSSISPLKSFRVITSEMGDVLKCQRNAILSVNNGRHAVENLKYELCDSTEREGSHIQLYSHFTSDLAGKRKVEIRKEKKIPFNIIKTYQ